MRSLINAQCSSTPSTTHLVLRLRLQAAQQLERLWLRHRALHAAWRVGGGAAVQWVARPQGRLRSSSSWICAGSNCWQVLGHRARPTGPQARLPASQLGPSCLWLLGGSEQLSGDALRSGARGNVAAAA